MNKAIAFTRETWIAIGIALLVGAPRVAGGLVVALHVLMLFAPWWARRRAALPMSRREVDSAARRRSPIGDEPRNVRHSAATMLAVATPRRGTFAGVEPTWYPPTPPRRQAPPPFRCYRHDALWCGDCTMTDGVTR